MVTHYENYGAYVDLVQNGRKEIITERDITKENCDNHFDTITNILRDGIEDPVVRAFKLHTTLADNHKITLSLVDYWFELMFWSFPVSLGDSINLRALFDTREITKSSIKKYFDKYIKRHRTTTGSKDLNNCIDNVMYKLKYINEFSMYLCNTVNFSDTIDLMYQFPEFAEAMHPDFTNVPVEEVKSLISKYTETQVKIIKNSEHCLRDSFKAKEAINIKQFGEVSVAEGIKPNGQGGIFPYIISNSYINGGVSSPEAYTIDSSNGRYAQTLQKLNVGIAGEFARELQLNNLETIFHPNPNYSCNTKHFIQVFIKDADILNKYNGRYYRFRKDGPEYNIDSDVDTHLIGQTVLMRSPITCASHMKGYGICKNCYGNLYYTNININPGIIATEQLSSRFTQMLLSAKHLLESSVIEMEWVPEFNSFFDIAMNTITLQNDIDTTGMYIVFDSNMFELEDSDDKEEFGIEYKEFMTSFDIIYPDGRVVNIHTADNDNIYLSEDLNRLMRSKKAYEDDGIYTIPLGALEALPVVFTVQIQNKELMRTLQRTKHIINRNKDTSSYTKDEIVRELLSANADGNIHLDSIHLEVIISNQIRDADNILEVPNWEKEDAPYRILALNSALINSRSITTTLEYQKIASTLVNPISTKKTKPSQYDLYFMEQPQNYIQNREMVSDKYAMEEDNDADGSLKEAVFFVDTDKPSVGTC